MAQKLCSIGGCSQRSASRLGYCSTHLYRHKHGIELDAPIKAGGVKGGKRCSIEGCDRLSNYGPQGYCRMHQMRVKRGIPLDSPLLRAPRGHTVPCIIEGCDRKRHSTVGYCEAHYYRYKRGLPLDDTPFIVKTKQPELCMAPGCDRKPYSLGYCTTHVAQHRKHGRVQSIRIHTIWDACSYGAVHRRCTALWGPASQHSCVQCGKSAHEWAYDGTDPSELYHDSDFIDAVRSILPYSLFPEFYMPMCKSCHKQRDMDELRVELKEFREWRKSKRSSALVDDSEPPF